MSTAHQRWAARNPEKVRANNKRQRDRRGKDVHNAEMREWRKNNPRAAKNADLKKRTGCTIEQYEALLAQQHGVCAACGSPPIRRALAVDHCHESGLIRGLLCDACNTALGLLRESPARFNALRDYITSFSWLE